MYSYRFVLNKITLLIILYMYYIHIQNKAKPTSSLGKQSGNFTTNSPPTSDDDHEQNKSSDDDDHYVDLTDVAEMDYSPARRKPPIHN